jgi:hypothetical protein
MLGLGVAEVEAAVLAALEAGDRRVAAHEGA